MAQRQITAPAATPVSLAEAKAYLRLEAESPATTEDALITSMINAATVWAEGVTRRALISQTWALSLPAFPSEPLRLPMGRVTAILGVTYLDSSGASQTMTGPSASPAAADYREYLQSDDAAYLKPTWGNAWPDTRDDEMAAVTVTYRPGYGPNATDVPEPIRQAILYRIADQYEHRGSQDGALTRIAHEQLQPFAIREQQP